MERAGGREGREARGKQRGQPLRGKVVVGFPISRFRIEVQAICLVLQARIMLTGSTNAGTNVKVLSVLLNGQHWSPPEKMSCGGQLFPINESLSLTEERQA